jgi:phosphoribosyl-ATP pyrophosphohydrolase
MPSFDELFETLSNRAQGQTPGSRTAELLELGTHAIGKKIVEEAAEVWMAAEHEGKQATTSEIAQLIYHLQVMMIDRDISLEDLEKEL